MGISELHILTDEQLLQMSQEGSETAEELLIEKYKNLVKSRSKQYYIVGADNEDVVQEGMIGLFKAIRSYDSRRNASFKTYAEECINNQILTAIKKANRLKHQPLNESVSINQDISKESEDGTSEAVLGDVLQDPSGNEPEELVLLKEIIQFLRAYDSHIFSSLERQVLEEKLKGKGYQEIAEALGRSPKSIDNTLQRIRKKVLAYLEE
ncbi:MAG: RNA polymerase sporulation sigma factor SigH [Firmicutes bacterium]|nr:RNA polymerase sporulation sigma factor SigH [Bacillota bacterium]